MFVLHLNTCRTFNMKPPQKETFDNYGQQKVSIQPSQSSLISVLLATLEYISF